MIEFDVFFEERLLDHSVVPSRSLHFQEQLYDLRSVVIHLGDSSRAGHYISVAKHETPSGDWWLFDDERRILAQDCEVNAQGTYRCGRLMKSYVLVYEKH